MAMHRITLDEDGRPPVELLTFRPDDWPGSPHETTWYPAYERWSAARSTWEDQHPGWLGDVIERLRDELETRHSFMRAWPLEEQGAVSVQSHVVREGVRDPVTGKIRGRLTGEEHIPACGTGARHCDWS